MKFDCGLSPDTKYRQNRARMEERVKELREWHRVFKIYVQLGDHDCRLFETVERRYPDVQLPNWSHRIEFAEPHHAEYREIPRG